MANLADGQIQNNSFCRCARTDDNILERDVDDVTRYDDRAHRYDNGRIEFDDYRRSEGENRQRRDGRTA